MTLDGHEAQPLHQIHNRKVLSWGRLPQAYFYVNLDFQNGKLSDSSNCELKSGESIMKGVRR